MPYTSSLHTGRAKEVERMENEETARKLCDSFFFPFLLHKLNTLDFNLLIAYAHCTRGFFFSFSFFISFQFFNFFIYWEWVYYGLLFFFSSFISSLVEPKKGKKKLLCYSILLFCLALTKKAIFFLPSWRSGCGLVYLLSSLSYISTLFTRGGCWLLTRLLLMSHFCFFSHSW